MTLPYNAAEADTTASPGQAQEGQTPDILPRGERDQDELRSEVAHDLTSLPSRPLTDEERQAAEHDTPPGERVYAPASERVPKAPVPGHRDLVEHPDEATAERQGVESSSTSEDGLVRTTRGRRRIRIPIGSKARREEGAANPELLAVAAAWFGLFACGALGMWLYLRWQRQRNRPVNRLRRQARWAAEELGDRLPASPEESRAVMSVAAALLSTGLVVWRRMRARQAPAASEYADQVQQQAWRRRLAALRARWTPPRSVRAEASLTVS